MTLLLLVTLPLLGALLISAVDLTRVLRFSAITAALVSLTALALALSMLPAILAGNVIVAEWRWVDAIGLNIAFRMDGLAMLFALLIVGIGLLVILYARYYFAGKSGGGRFLALMLVFMASMLGIVTSENLLFMLVFWEMTSLVSFLLIGFHSDQRPARRGARLTLVITSGGGLALMAGVILIGQIVGSFHLSEVLAAGDALREHRQYPLILSLVLLGAMTKSAQFPFHLWLPHAMTAPTPVSVYLHSATMVKAGIFLLARLHPVLADTSLWLYGVSAVGMATLLTGAFVAMFKHDTKGLLAYSTVSHLGLITLLLGMGTKMGLIVGLFHLLNHALFKAPLFMMAGIVENSTGSRDMRRINGMWHFMPFLGALTAIAAASMAGLPLLNGFLSKKMFFAETMVSPFTGPLAWLVPALAAVAGLLTVAYSIRIFHNVFFNGEPRNLPIWPPKPPGTGILIPVALLSAACIVVGIVPQYVVHTLLHTAAEAALGDALPPYNLGLLHHFNLPFLMSVLALTGGLAMYLARQQLFALYDRLPEVDAKENFEWLMLQAGTFAERQVHRLENGSVQRYIAFVLISALVMMGSALTTMTEWRGPQALTPLDPMTVFGAVLLMATALGAVIGHRNRLFALLLMGAAGLFVTLTFARFSAPDLALTQLSVEVMAVIIMMLALSFLPQRTPSESSHWRRGRDLTLAALSGLGVATMAFAVMTRPSRSISDFFLTRSVPEGGGANVVNVILVDFRGFDTLGEITVLGIAAVAVFALTRNLQLKDRMPQALGQYWAHAPHPLILRMIARPILPVALMVSAYIFLRGHHLPGGGFIAGLIAAVALSLQYMSCSLAWAHSRMLTPFRPLVGGGILLAALTGLGSLAVGAPFLTGWFEHYRLPVLGDIELATALLFDFGVFTTVVGATLLILANLGKLMTLQGPGKEIG
ncbi:monovalent cation/H+ antiporter subunit A [Litchfieldella qijiaojingensis]|uniref:Monovalent cation/H+ antiporter subunit A n=1 Tax=Litchfieldella qijiaojingensis TaxID=980347 RepID=A0ABQ2YJB4_9GAMM|nr:monovalent cation/H+ antiporter subunit A [Halomonas qijiaojingensis]GGX85973.1 monovalent cation/H+ antiporter subunit A [Halomonas qijiaojingensis]